MLVLFFGINECLFAEVREKSIKSIVQLRLSFDNIANRINQSAYQGEDILIYGLEPSGFHFLKSKLSAENQYKTGLRKLPDKDYGSSLIWLFSGGIDCDRSIINRLRKSGSEYAENQTRGELWLKINHAIYFLVAKARLLEKPEKEPRRLTITYARFPRRFL